MHSKTKEYIQFENPIKFWNWKLDWQCQLVWHIRIGIKFVKLKILSIKNGDQISIERFGSEIYFLVT